MNHKPEIVKTRTLKIRGKRMEVEEDKRTPQGLIITTYWICNSIYEKRTHLRCL